MTLADILNKLAEIDDNIIQLEGELALAQQGGDSAQVTRLQDEIRRLLKAKEGLRTEFKRKHAR